MEINQEKKLIAGLYYRISTADKQSLDMQIKSVKDYCNREGIEIYKEYGDTGQSGSKESRPMFDLMLKDMRDKKFDCVVVYKLDRIGRSLSHLVKLFEEFRKKGIDFISTTQSINTLSPEGRMFLHILMVLAEYERELTISRINSGLDQAKEQIKEKGFGITKEGKKYTSLGRPKGSSDKKRRRTSGYVNRWIKQSTPNKLNNFP